MALVDYNLRLIGKLGNLVYYYSSQSGTELHLSRAYCIPVQPGTPGQLANWSKFSTAVANWQAFTPVQKEYYEQLSRAAGVNLPGYNYYISLFMLGKI
jgi:hypothetical protein